MASTSSQPLIAIVGPTASGKTALAIKLALQCNGEIICADSRTVYKGMDIGTAKPTGSERQQVPHHLLDVVEPNQSFSVADFQRLAYAAMADIRKRRKVPFVVGGSGLYVDSVVLDYQFGLPANETLRTKLSDMTIPELYNYCLKNNINLPENFKNKRYLVRAIELDGAPRIRKETTIEDCLVDGIATDKEELRRRIKERAEILFATGMLEEAARIGQHYGWHHESMTGNIYRLAAAVYRGDISKEEAKAKFVTLDWRLAKRQLTWLRRHSFIHWGSAEEVAQMVGDYLK